MARVQSCALERDGVAVAGTVVISPVLRHIIWQRGHPQVGRHRALHRIARHAVRVAVRALVHYINGCVARCGHLAEVPQSGYGILTRVRAAASPLCAYGRFIYAPRARALRASTPVMVPAWSTVTS